MKRDYLLDLMRLKNTVFTIKDLALIWQETNMDLTKKRIYRYVKGDKMYSLRRGIYAKDKNYDKYELANKIFTPSYISFETVLAKAGVIFQFYGQIFAASYLTRELSADNQSYSFKKIKDCILTDKTGIKMKNNYFIASPERAFLDTIYLNKDYYFDNLSGINWDKVDEILPIYEGNKRMAAKIKKFRQKEKGE